MFCFHCKFSSSLNNVVMAFYFITSFVLFKCVCIVFLFVLDVVKLVLQVRLTAMTNVALVTS